MNAPMDCTHRDDPEPRLSGPLRDSVERLRQFDEEIDWAGGDDPQ